MRTLVRTIIAALLLSAPVQALTSISAYKTFTREILTSSDLNSSFTTVISGVNNLIAFHPGDSTITKYSAPDTIVARPGPNINIVGHMVFRDNDDSLVVPGRISADTMKVDDQLWIGMTAPIVGFSGGTTAGTRLNWSYEATDTTNAVLLQLGGTDVTATATELNILDGVTATATELNILDGVTATATELNILDGVTATATELNILDGVTTELNILDGVTATATELNILDGVTATATELNILDGVTASATELNLIDGYTGTTANLNTLTNDSIGDALHRHANAGGLGDWTHGGICNLTATGTCGNWDLDSYAVSEIAIAVVSGSANDNLESEWSLVPFTTRYFYGLLLKGSVYAYASNAGPAGGTGHYLGGTIGGTRASAITVIADNTPDATCQFNFTASTNVIYGQSLTNAKCSFIWIYR